MHNEAYNGSVFIEIIGEESKIKTINENNTNEKTSDIILQLRNITELVILTVGIILNTLIFVSIIFRSFMRTSSSGYYIISLIISNFILLIDVLDNVLNTWFNIKFNPDVDFISRVTLQASIHTIAIFSLDRYITYCRNGTIWHKEILEKSTGLKAILIVWSFASITTAQELHLYEMFNNETVINLYVFFTIMYLVLPTGIILFVGTLIVIQIIENNYDNNNIEMIDTNEILGLLVGMILGFYLTMVPLRIITIIYYTPSFHCCKSITMHGFYYLSKSTTIIGPMLWIKTSNQLRKSVKETLLGHYTF